MSQPGLATTAGVADYDHRTIESHWQARWEAERVFVAVEDPTKVKFYALSMFPYPSGSGLHVGHPLSYTAIDVVARSKRMQGYSVLNPMGFDAFGLPAERAAQREGIHPAVITREHIDYFRVQLKRLGFSFDWSREVVTSEPEYYRWTQWIFLKLYERGLAYLEDVPVWWCEAQGTVLANEEVVDGHYVETGDPVVRRNMRQWMLRITEYAQRLLDDLDSEELDWPDGVREMQRRWIGRSEGAEVSFSVQPGLTAWTGDIVVYTTRPDTIFGASYLVLSPEHPLVDAVTTQERRGAVVGYRDLAATRSERQRQVESEHRVTGVDTGGRAVNPATGETIPIWVADYVLMGYGTGAVMGVAAHDARDHSFALAFDLPIIPVVEVPDGVDLTRASFSGAGRVINSGRFNGLDTAEMILACTDWLIGLGVATRKINYKLRDWLFSRQRYWGEPFPILHVLDDHGAPTGEILPVPEGDLPVTLPYVDDYRPTALGEPPLARAADWLRTMTPDGRPALRETNTMPQWAGSCWYYLRYMDPLDTAAPFSKERVSYWRDVDLYIGGVEHAVLHLLYARFWHKVLYDIGLVPTKEPFRKLFNQGMIVAHSYRDEKGKYHRPEDVVDDPTVSISFTSSVTGQPVESHSYVLAADGSRIGVEVRSGKMGKSLNNSVDPLSVVDRYGADTLRIYEMFMGPLEQTKIWDTSGCEGVHRFLARVWRLYVDPVTGQPRPFAEHSRPEVHRALQVAIKETTLGIAELRFNTLVARMMELVNACQGDQMSRTDAESFLLVLSPLAPHLAEELWSRLGHEQSLATTDWPVWDEAALTRDVVTIVVQVGGQFRARVTVPRDSADVDVLAVARHAVQRHLQDKTVQREVVVPGRVVNFVV